MARKRRQHRPSFYDRMLGEAVYTREILELVDDAAHQPRSIISDKDYEKIYWRAQALLAKKGEWL